MSKLLNRFSLTRLADFVLIVLICTFVAGPVHGDDPELEFTIINNRNNIVDIANAGDGSGRLFLVQQSGRIYIHDGGMELDSPFLDIRTRAASK